MSIGMRCGLAVVLSIVTLTSCMRGGGKGISTPLPAGLFGVPSTIDYAVPERAGNLSRAEAVLIAPKIRALSADPTEFQHIVGDTIRFTDDVRILAVDSAGIVLGELPAYDFSFPVRSLRLLPDGRFVCVRAGTVRFTARLPKEAWTGAAAKRPATIVTINVASDAP